MLPQKKSKPDIYQAGLTSMFICASNGRPILNRSENADTEKSENKSRIGNFNVQFWARKQEQPEKELANK